MLLSLAVSKFVKSRRKRGHSTAHVSTVELRLTRLLRELGPVPIEQIKSSSLLEHLYQLQASGLASATCAGHKATIRSFFRWCKKRGLLKKDPSKRLRRFPASYKPVRSTAAPQSHLHAALTSLDNYIKAHPNPCVATRDAALLSLAVDSAGRRGELLGLTRSEIIRALEAPTRTQNGRLVYRARSAGKTGPITLRFFAPTARYFQLWLSILPHTAVYIFVKSRTGKPLAADAAWLAFKRICQFANVPPFRFHAVRKRVLTDLILATGDPKLAQRLAGHSTSRTTMEYYDDIQETYVDAAAEQLASSRRGPYELAADFFRQTFNH